MYSAAFAGAVLAIVALAVAVLTFVALLQYCNINWCGCGLIAVLAVRALLQYEPFYSLDCCCICSISRCSLGCCSIGCCSLVAVLAIVALVAAVLAVVALVAAVLALLQY